MVLPVEQSRRTSRGEGAGWCPQQSAVIAHVCVRWIESLDKLACMNEIA